MVNFEYLNQSNGKIVSHFKYNVPIRFVATDKLPPNPAKQNICSVRLYGRGCIICFAGLW